MQLPRTVRLGLPTVIFALLGGCAAFQQAPNPDDPKFIKVGDSECALFDKETKKMLISQDCYKHKMEKLEAENTARLKQAQLEASLTRLETLSKAPRSNNPNDPANVIMTLEAMRLMDESGMSPEEMSKRLDGRVTPRTLMQLSDLFKAAINGKCQYGLNSSKEYVVVCEVPITVNNTPAPPVIPTKEKTKGKAAPTVH